MFFSEYTNVRLQAEDGGLCQQVLECSQCRQTCYVCRNRSLSPKGMYVCVCVCVWVCVYVTSVSISARSFPYRQVELGEGSQRASLPRYLSCQPCTLAKRWEPPSTWYCLPWSRCSSISDCVTTITASLAKMRSAWKNGYTTKVSSVHFSPLTDWVVGGTRQLVKLIQQRFQSMGLIKKQNEFISV